MYWEWLALAYVVIGLGTAAVVYHVLSGDLDIKTCEGCGETHSDPETDHIFDQFRIAREMHPVSIGIVTGIACLMITLVWPIAVAIFGVLAVKSYGQLK